MSERLINISKVSDIFPEYIDTPISMLLEYHNLKRPFEPHTQAEILIGMCMDNRNHIRIPGHFAFIIRTGGANLRYSEFKVSFAISVGGVKNIALIGHTNCGMLNLSSQRDQFVKGLVKNAGWEVENAEEHFSKYAPLFEIGNEIDFTLSEARRLRDRYPSVRIAPMIYRVEDHRLYLIRE